MASPTASTPKQPASPSPPCQSHYPSPRQTSEEGSAPPTPTSRTINRPPWTDSPTSNAAYEVDELELKQELEVLDRLRPRAHRPTPFDSPTPHSPPPHDQSPSPDAFDLCQPKKRRRRSSGSKSSSDKQTPSPAEQRAVASRRAAKNRVKRERRKAVADALTAAVQSGRINAHTVTQGTLDSIALAATRKWDRAEQRRQEKEDRRRQDRRRRAQAAFVKRAESERLGSVLEIGDSEEEIDLLDED